MKKLTGRVTVLGRFISKLGERALPFFKMMKKKGPFEWTLEADQAFQDLKRYLTSPPVMVAPRPLEPLVLYLSATPHSASAALVALREERQVKGLSSGTNGPDGAAWHQGKDPEAATASADHQAPEAEDPKETPQPPEVEGSVRSPALVEHPVYFVSTVLRDAWAQYPMPQKILLALLVARASCATTSRVIPSRSCRLTHWKECSRFAKRNMSLIQR